MEVVMDNIIDVSIPVAEVVDKHPEVLEILVELGFKPLVNPLMRKLSVVKYRSSRVLSWKELLWTRLSAHWKQTAMK